MGGGNGGFFVPGPRFRKFWVENACRSRPEAPGYLSQLPSPSAQPVAPPLSGSLSLSRAALTPLIGRRRALWGRARATRGPQVSSVPLGIFNFAFFSHRARRASSTTSQVEADGCAASSPAARTPPLQPLMRAGPQTRATAEQRLPAAAGCDAQRAATQFRTKSTVPVLSPAVADSERIESLPDHHGRRTLGMRFEEPTQREAMA